jgi:hypothetical protein
VRRLVGWIGGAVGGITAYRLWRRRPQVAAEPSPETVPAPEPTEPDARAEELRAKLAESRVAEPGPEEAAPEPVAEEKLAVEPESPEDRRRQVHEEGRAAVDEMKSDRAGE